MGWNDNLADPNDYAAHAEALSSRASFDDKPQAIPLGEPISAELAIALAAYERKQGVL